VGGGRVNQPQAGLLVESSRRSERYRRETRQPCGGVGGVPSQRQVRVKGRGHPRVGHEAGLEEIQGGTRLRPRAVIRTRDAPAEAIDEIRRTFSPGSSWDRLKPLMPRIDADGTLQQTRSISQAHALATTTGEKRRQRQASHRGFAAV